MQCQSNVTALSGYTPFTGASANSGSAGNNASNISVLGQYKVVSSIGTYDSAVSMDGFGASTIINWCTVS